MDAWLVPGWRNQSQDGLISPRMAQLVPGWPSQSQDGLVSLRMAQLVPRVAQLVPRMAQLWPTSWKNGRFLMIFPLGRSNWLQITKKSFYVFCIFAPLYRRFRPSRVLQTIELEKIYRFVLKILNFMPYGSVLSRFCDLYRFSIDFQQIFNRF